MEFIVGIDDTDNQESRGTGHLAELLRQDIELLFGGKTSRITRHQLFVCDDIPYTSHNSSMCFTGSIEEAKFDRLIEHAGNLLIEKSAVGSDPGLCVAATGRICNRAKLISFGHGAMGKVLTKEQALAVAADTGVHLSEHGGTGGGIIGALAAIGLRLDGNSGRFRGWLEIIPEHRYTTVGKLLESYELDQVKDISGGDIHMEHTLHLDERIKTVLLEGLSVLLVKKVEGNDSERINLSREEIRRY